MVTTKNETAAATTAPAADEAAGTDIVHVQEKPTAGALAILEQSKFLVLRDNDVRQSIAENLAREAQFSMSDLVHVPTPTGGITKWTFNDIDGEKTVDAITGLCVLYSLGGTLWPTEGSAIPGTLPYLRTDDLVTAYRVGDDSGDLPVDEIEKFRLPNGLYDWARMTNDKAGGIFGWGTGQTGKGKRVTEYRVICLLRENDSFPLLFRAGPGSLKDVKKFFIRLHPWWRSVVTLKLKKATGVRGAYSVMDPSFVGWISKEEGEAIRAMYVEPLRRMVNQLPLPISPADSDE